MKKLKKSLLSIGIPTHNRCTLLKKTISSLLHQTYKNIEIIISDNVSTDETAIYCKSLVRKYKNIHYYRQKKAIPVADNFSYCVQKATGEFFMWASDDDLWDRNYCKILINKLTNNSSAILAFSDCYIFSDSKKLDFRVNLPKDFDFSYFSCIKYILGLDLNSKPSILYGVFRTHILKKTGAYINFWGNWSLDSEFLTVLYPLRYGTFIYQPGTLFIKRESGFVLDKYFGYKNIPINKYFWKRVRTFLLVYFKIFIHWGLTVKWLFQLPLPFHQQIYLALYYQQIFIRLIIQMISDTIYGFVSIARNYIAALIRS